MKHLPFSSVNLLIHALCPQSAFDELIKVELKLILIRLMHIISICCVFFFSFYLFIIKCSSVIESGANTFINGESCCFHHHFNITIYSSCVFFFSSLLCKWNTSATTIHELDCDCIFAFVIYFRVDINEYNSITFAINLCDCFSQPRLKCIEKKVSQAAICRIAFALIV